VTGDYLKHGLLDLVNDAFGVGQEAESACSGPDDLNRVTFKVGQLKKISLRYGGLLKHRLFNIVLVAFSSDQ
jgi:hypothetical protein